MPTNVDVGCCRCGRYTCSPEAGRDCTLANGGGGGAARGSDASAASGGCTPPPTAPDRGSGGRGATAVDAARRPPFVEMAISAAAVGASATSRCSCAVAAAAQDTGTRRRGCATRTT